MGEYAVQPAEHIDEVLHANILAMSVVVNNKAAGEDLLVGHDVGSPIQCMAAVVNGATALRLLMHSTKKLPFRSAHLRARVRTAWRGVEEETNDQGVALRDEEAAEFIEPDGSVHAARRCRKLQCGFAGNRSSIGSSMVTMESGEVFLKLEGRVQLGLVSL